MKRELADYTAVIDMADAPAEQKATALVNRGWTLGQRGDMERALADCTAAPFALRFKGVGFFPPRGLPRVVWAGVERSEPLQVLQRKIVTRLFQLGVEPDNRRFSPHLTLARLGDTPPAKVGRWLEHNGLFAAEPFTVDRFLLYSSVLGRKGASHTVEQEYLLGG